METQQRGLANRVYPVWFGQACLRCPSASSSAVENGRGVITREGSSDDYKQLFISHNWLDGTRGGDRGVSGVGQPRLVFAGFRLFGTLNEICIGLTAILSAVLAWSLYSGHYAQARLLSQAALLATVLGAVVVVAGSVLLSRWTAKWNFAVADTMLCPIQA